MCDGLAFSNIGDSNGNEGYQKKPSDEYQHPFVRASPYLDRESLEEFADGVFKRPESRCVEYSGS
jgi:hypothetical protein